jgi:adenosylcobinamide-GDP ribazoletransferase
MGSIEKTIKQMLLSISFLTIIPVRIGRVDDKHISGAGAFYPVTGYIIGFAVYGAYSLGNYVAEGAIASVFAVAAWLFVTRALHLDGLMDVADGFWGGHTPGNRMRIMKDSGVGAFGVAAGIIVIIAKVVIIQQIDEKDVFAVLLIAPAAGRMAAPFAGLMSRRAAGEGLGSAFVKNLNWGILLLALVFFVAPMLFLVSPLCAAAVCGAVLVISIVMVLLAHKKIGGMNGDVFGAAMELTECAVLLVLVSAGRHGLL